MESRESLAQFEKPARAITNPNRNSKLVEDKRHHSPFLEIGPFGRCYQNDS
jgi:hypothetical protein